MNAQADSCTFCAIIDGSVESSEVYRGDSCIAFLDVSPVNPGHTLVCPLRHVSSFVDLEATESSEILAAAQRITRILLTKIPDCEGVNLLLSDGEVAGQEVDHAHFHVVPRARNDGFGWKRFGSPASRTDLDAIAARLRDS